MRLRDSLTFPFLLILQEPAQMAPPPRSFPWYLSLSNGLLSLIWAIVVQSAITGSTFSLDCLFTYLSLISELLSSKGCVIDDFCPQSPAWCGDWDRCWGGGACSWKWCWACLAPSVEASLKPLALLTLLAPAIQAFFWVLEHTWLVSASTLAFPSAGNYLQVFPWQAPLYSLGPSQVDLLRYVFPNTSGQEAPLPCPHHQPTHHLILLLSNTDQTLKLWPLLNLYFYCHCYLISAFLLLGRNCLVHQSKSSVYQWCLAHERCFVPE